MDARARRGRRLVRDRQRRFLILIRAIRVSTRGGARKSCLAAPCCSLHLAGRCVSATCLEKSTGHAPCGGVPLLSDSVVMRNLIGTLVMRAIRHFLQPPGGSG